MAFENKIAQWVSAIRDQIDIPARLILWGQEMDFGDFSSPLVTIKIKNQSAAPLLLDPTLANLGEAYIKGKIDIEGKLTDIINIGHALARNVHGPFRQVGKDRTLFYPYQVKRPKVHPVPL